MKVIYRTMMLTYGFMKPPWCNLLIVVFPISDQDSYGSFHRQGGVIGPGGQGRFRDRSLSGLSPWTNPLRLNLQGVCPSWHTFFLISETLKGPAAPLNPHHHHKVTCPRKSQTTVIKLLKIQFAAVVFTLMRRNELK